MPDINAPFTVINGVSLTGNSLKLTLAPSNTPNTDLIFRATGTTGNVYWSPPSPFTILSSSLGGTKYIPHMSGSTVTTGAASSGSSTIVYFYPYWITSTETVNACAISTNTNPTVTGTITAKVYRSSGGKPVGPTIGNFGTITTTANSNTIFVSSSSVTLSPGMYWIGVSYSASLTNMRGHTAEPSTMYRVMGHSNSSAFSALYVLQQSGPTSPPETVGTLNIQTSATPSPGIWLRT
jgi:hypothetical protein